MDTLGKRIEIAIQNSFKKKKDIALKIGVHANTITDWIQDKKEPGINKIRSLAVETGCDINWLIMGEEKSVAAPPVVREPQPLYNIGAPLASKIEGLNTYHRAVVEEIVEGLLKIEGK